MNAEVISLDEARRSMPHARSAPRRARAVKQAPTLQGDWNVRRISGLLPPFVTKRIGMTSGWTFWFGVPCGWFRVEGRTLRYLLWPVRDELRRVGDHFVGRGLVFGREFCRFRLERR